MERKTVILGGGTFQPIRNHLSLAAPAFGTTAKQIHWALGGELILTKMANWTSPLVTNDDVEELIDELLERDDIGTIVMNVAMCDYEAIPINGVDNGWHAKRLKTSEGNVNITLTPTEKVISKIRKKRPDIFLVGFKTTTGETSEDQFLIALKMMKKTKCNLVLANDVVTRNNMIITPEETIYSETILRGAVIEELSNMIKMRSNLTYHRGSFTDSENIPFDEAPNKFKDVIRFLIDNGGYIENNGNGFTPGHFCYRLNEDSFVSSQRGVNHNEVIQNGFTLVKVDENGDLHYYGKRKPSVGARSQNLMLKQNPEYDFIVHTHNPLKEGSKIPVASQKPFQCGSLECGLNTVNNMKDFNEGRLKAVYLDKHGINLLFKKEASSEEVIEFLKENIELGIKVI